MGCLEHILFEHLVMVTTVVIVLKKVDVMGAASTKSTSERKIKGSIERVWNPLMGFH